MKLKIPLIGSFVVAAAMCLYTCGPNRRIKNRDGLIEYISQPDNGLTIVHHIGKVTAALSYKPAQLMTNSEPGNPELKKKNISPALTRNFFFVLSLSAGNKELIRQLPADDYTEMIQVLSFRMKDFVSAVCDQNGKWFDASECIFQQTYGMGSSSQLLIVFDRAKFLGVGDVDIKIKEFGLNTGNLDFVFKLKNINLLNEIAVN